MNQIKIIHKLKFYLPIHIAIFYLLPLLGANTGLAILVLLILSPVLSLITGFIFGIKEGWYWWYSLVAGILFLPCIWVYYNSSAWVYLPIYTLCILIGQLIGCAFLKPKK